MRNVPTLIYGKTYLDAKLYFSTLGDFASDGGRPNKVLVKSSTQQIMILIPLETLRLQTMFGIHF